MTKNSNEVPCPVCHDQVDVMDVIPLYVGKKEHEEMTDKLPKRPTRPQNPFEEPEDDNFNMFFNILGF